MKKEKPLGLEVRTPGKKTGGKVKRGQRGLHITRGPYLVRFSFDVQTDTKDPR